MPVSLAELASLHNKCDIWKLGWVPKACPMRPMMLRIMRLDLVRLVLPVEPQWFSVLIENLSFIGEEYGFKCKKFSGGAGMKWLLWMKIGDQQLTVVVYYAYAYRRIEYRYKGEIDYQAFQDRLAVLQEYGLASAMVYGRVKRLELAIDVPNAHTKDFICHCGGLHNGSVLINAAGNGRTFYLGSQLGYRQFAVYDKAQQLKDKGEPHPKGDLLRVELRILNRSCSFVDLVKDLFENDPFRQFHIVRKSTLLAEPKKAKHWSLLVEACSTVGVAKATKQFPEQRKTLLNALKTHSFESLKPKLKEFEGVFGRYLSAANALKSPI